MQELGLEETAIDKDSCTVSSASNKTEKPAINAPKCQILRKVDGFLM